MKRIIYLTLSIICVIGLFSGCKASVKAQTENYSFNDPNIVVYVNGEPAYEAQLQQYFDIKKAYMNAIVECGSQPYFKHINPDNDISVEESYLDLESYYERNYNKAEEYLKYNFNEVKDDYYKTYVIELELKKYKQDMSKIEKMVNQWLEAANEGLIFSVDDDSQIDLTADIKSIAKKYNISYQECLQNVYKPFYKYQCEEEILGSYFLTYVYKGNIVKYDGENAKEYKACILDYSEKYDEYVDDLLEKAEVIERPDSMS